MAYSALQLNTNALYQAVTQTAHGFSVGQVLRFNGASFVLADNTSEANAAVVGMVSSIVNADQFYLTQEGFVAGLTTSPTGGGPYVAGTRYYLSAIPGELTVTKPVADGSVVLALYDAYTATSGFFQVGGGSLNKPSDFLNWNVVSTDQSMAVGNAYVLTGGTNRNFLLPATASVGDTILVSNIGTGNFTITQNAGQSQLFVNNVASTTGVGGSIASTNQYSVLQLVCVVANNEFLATSALGNFTIV